MRIASLVPSATEALFALGLGDQVVAVTHECDHPVEVLRLPRLTRSVLPPGLGPGEVDARVREITGRGEALYELDQPTLARLEPDLIVTQALCAVCAVSYDDVRAVAERLASRPEVISLDPKRLAHVLDDLIQLADACGDRARGVSLRARLQARLDRLRDAVAGAPRPRVLGLEWLDPPYVAAHWVPEMIELAGGTSLVGEPGRDSREAGWEELAAAEADLVVAMPCGLYVEEAAEQALGARGTESRGSGRRGWWPSTRRDRSPAPDRASWKARSCSATSCTPTACRVRTGLAWRELAPAQDRV